MIDPDDTHRRCGPPRPHLSSPSPIRSAGGSWNCSRDEELCVCHLVEELDAAQPLVSHHLKVLRDAGVVVGERWRYWTYYRLVPGAVESLTLSCHGSPAPAPAPERRPCC